MRVVSFKVNDKTYVDLKKIVKEHNLNFTLLFQPIAHDIASGNTQPMKYTKYTLDKAGDLHQDLVSLRKSLDEIIKQCDLKR